MPITKSQSPLQSLHADIQSIIATYGPELLEKALKEAGLSSPTLESQKEEIAFEQACEFFITCSKFLGLSKTSQETYLYELGLFQNFIFAKLGKDSMLEQTAEPSLLVEYLSACQNSNTRSKKSAFLRTFFKTTFRHFWMMDITDLKGILKITWSEDYLPRAFTREQLGELIKRSQLQRTGQRDHVIIWTFLGSGIRLNELCNLQIGDIEPVRQTIKVIAKGKSTKRERMINQHALFILLEYIYFKYACLKEELTEAEFSKLYVFSNDNGQTAIQRRTVQHMITKLIKQTKSIPEDQKKRYSTHTFRHCFAVYALEEGIDIYTLSKLLGHDSINSTAVYLKLFDEHLKRAIERHPFASVNM
ncbi:tyrosine-type recombinase/integrase [Aneurinibacillus migulanus]|uniref:Integrase/recombinase XerD n=1 Tax=Aneurinibacillus migulanus TaxID=47500 RepID=A0A0D1W3D2_ANEMI|nr:tyrosine-type recombinase/integrase [Aneurinibacillus migulanus]KIV52900.1 hypothetical protein TS65_22640 [Aneurinibacillus migulanus]KON95177.1 hypothetical protein AF333_06480 [Aneurinibacillus migulanus]MED0890912.1 tyrosine-type recombinase/integrase [Aneurinibacillus migulanus]MED1616604.1 tyrosine-type recombinase/integrase [Aneurinibacillus migulanus]SDI82403.1 integrase/recombinase XerD [Aneurinibacillus migulanus]